MDEQKSACVAVVGTGADVAPAVLADAVAGKYGTLSEIALALKLGRRVVGIGTWEIEGVQRASGPAETVELALG